MRAGRWLALSLIWILPAAGFAPTVGFAEEGDEAPPQAPAEPPEGSSAESSSESLSDSEEEAPPPPPKRRPRGGPREKDAEGTEAPSKFEADVIKSPYHDKRGNPYEVDTD